MIKADVEHLGAGLAPSTARSLWGLEQGPVSLLSQHHLLLIEPAIARWALDLAKEPEIVQWLTLNVLAISAKISPASRLAMASCR